MPGTLIEMVPPVSNSYVVGLRKMSLNGVVTVVVSLLLVFGHLEFRIAWAQGDGDTEMNLKETVHSAVEKGLGVTLNEITWKDKSKWAFQAIIIPERLQEYIPIYVYPWNGKIISKYEIQPASFDLYIGVADMFRDSSDEDKMTWKALPFPPQAFETILRSEDGRASVDDGDGSPYLVSSKPIAGMQEEQRLWVQKGNWEDGLNQIQSESSH